MISRYLKSKWWNLTAAVTSFATVGYVIYIAVAFHIFFVWFFMASLFMTVYESSTSFLRTLRMHDVT